MRQMLCDKTLYSFVQMGMKLYFFFFILFLYTIFRADARFLEVYIHKR